MDSSRIVHILIILSGIWMEGGCMSSVAFEAPTTYSTGDSSIGSNTTTTSTTTTTTLPTPPPPTEVNVTGCGITKSCYRNPEGCTNCSYVITWRYDEVTQLVHFEMQATLTGSHDYISVGTSHDKFMALTSVVDCIHTGGTSRPVQIQMSWNLADGVTNAPLDDKLLGLEESSLQSFFQDGQLVCRFSRHVSVQSLLNRYKRQTSEAELVYDLNDFYYIMVAIGPEMNGFKEHHEIVDTSPSKVNCCASEFVDLGGSSGYPLVKAHGVLMILAWMVCASWAVLMPRYSKKAWPGKTCCGKPIWIQLHIGLMVMTLFLTVAGFIIIFVSVKGYARSEDMLGKVHPPLGIITTALIIINPIMGAFRPNPNASKRPLFNGFHLAVGLLGHICAVVSIFLSLYMDKTNAPSWGIWIMVAYICWHAVMEIALTINMKCTTDTSKIESTKDDPNLAGVPLDQNGSFVIISETSEAQSKSGRVVTAMVVLHLLGVLGLSLALIVPIAQA